MYVRLAEVRGGNTFQHPYRDALGERAGELGEGVPSRERVVHRRQPLLAREAREHRAEVQRVADGRAAAGQGRNLGCAEPLFGGASPSGIAPTRPIDPVSLRSPGRERDALHLRPCQSDSSYTRELGRALLDLRPPLREMPQNRVGNAVDLEQAAAGLAPRDPRQPSAHLGPQNSSVHGAGRGLVLIRPVRVKRVALPLRASQVRDDDMRVQLRVTGARHPVPIPRRDEPLATTNPSPRSCCAPACPRRVRHASRSK